MPNERTFPDELAPPGLRIGALLAIAASVLVLLGASFGVLYWFFTWQAPDRYYSAPRRFPEPQVLQDESLQLTTLRQEQQRRLQSFGWVDRDKQIIAIPIDRAMQLLAQRGSDGYAPIIQPTQDGEKSQGGGEQAPSVTPEVPANKVESARPGGTP